MPHFVYDLLTLPHPKSDFGTLPFGADPAKFVSSSDWNLVAQACLDLRDVAVNATFQGFARSATPPNGANKDYLWLSTAPQLKLQLNDGTNQDIAYKSYVDSVAQGLSVKPPADAATTLALPANTATASTLTGSAFGAFPTVDGVPAVVGNSYLVKNEASAVNNGIYDLTTLGSGASSWVLTRIAQLAVGAQATGSSVLITGGTVSNGATFVCTSPESADTVGTHALTWSLFTQPALDRNYWVDSAGPDSTLPNARFTQALAAPLVLTSASGQSGPLQARPTLAAGDAATAFRHAYEAVAPAGAGGSAARIAYKIAGTYDASLASVDADVVVRAYRTTAGAGLSAIVRGGDAAGAGPSAGGDAVLRPGLGVGGGAGGGISFLGSGGAEIGRFSSTGSGALVIGGTAAVGSERLRVVGDVRFEGKATITGAIDPTTYTGTDLMTLENATASGAAGLTGPQRISLRSTQAADATNTIRNPGYVGFQGNYWSGAASVPLPIGSYSVVVDTLTAGVPSSYRHTFYDRVGAQIAAIDQAGDVTAGTGLGRFRGAELRPGATDIAPKLNGTVLDSATAVGVRFGNAVTFVTAGAKIAGFFTGDAATERAAVDKDGNYVPQSGSGLATLRGAGTATLQAFNTGSSSYTAFATLTAGATPAFDLAESATKAGGYIYRVGGTDVAIADGGTGASSWTATGVLFATTATALANGSRLAWDNTNFRLGINALASPLADLVVGGVGGVNAGLEIAPGVAVTAQAFNRNTAAYAALNVDGSVISLRPSGVEAFRASAGQGLFLDGTASAPGIAFIGELNTGLYRLSSGRVLLKVAGSTAFDAVASKLSVPPTIDTVAVNSLTLKGQPADGATAVGLIVDTNALVTSGALIASFRNGAAQKAYIDKDGRLVATAGTAALPGIAPGTASAGMFGQAADVLGWATAGVERLRLDASGNLIMQGDLDWTPSVDAQGELGTDLLRWSRVRAVTVTTGDLDMRDDARGAHWTLREEPDRLVAINRMTGRRYRVMLAAEQP